MSESDIQRDILDSLEQINDGIQQIVAMQSQKMALIRDYQQSSQNLQQLKDNLKETEVTSQ